MVKLMKFKCILLSLTLISIFLICVSSINAAEVNDDINSNTTSDDLSHLKINNDDLNNNAGCLENEEVELQNDTDNLNISDLISINQTSDNTFTIELDNVTTTAYRAYVYDLDSFNKLLESIRYDNMAYDAIVIDFKDNLVLEINSERNFLMNLGGIETVVLRGNNTTISVRNPSENDEKHFTHVGAYQKLWMNDITIKGFNTAIINEGVCQFRNVNFESNREWYLFTEDRGGAIRNYGILKCANCSFTKNQAKNGGAIYNYKGSQSMFFDCNFADNVGYAKAEYGVVETDDGDNIYTSKGANCIITNSNDGIYGITINCTEDLVNALAAINSLGHVRDLIMDFAPNITCKLSKADGFKFSFESVENLLINGNGATISVDTDTSDECHFLKVHEGQNYQINGLTISGFNRAIFNEGSLFLTNTIFKNNKCDYYFAEDYGGAIYNEGILYLTKCEFKNSYAKYGSAIYNKQGVLRCSNCNFESNTAYGDGGAIYNYQGHLISIMTTFSGNNAKDDGGAIYNDHGIMVLNDNSFNGNSASDQGGAIYNDVGSISLSGNVFTSSKAKEGKEIFTYGEESKYYIGNDSYVLQQVEDGYICKTIKLTSDKASEPVRWVLRVTEIGLCIGLCVACSVSGIPEVSGFFIGFIGGALFAAGEEYIEDCYLDHNFNIWNLVVMSAIAGFFDGATTAAGIVIGKTCFKVGTEAFTAAMKFKLEVVCFCLELGGEILTEFLPRFDFSEVEVPTPPQDNETSANRLRLAS